MAKHAEKNTHSNTIQCNHSEQWKPRDNRFFPPRTDGSRHNHRCSLLHKRIGYCTSITIITGSDCSSTSQKNLHKTVFPKCSFFTPATNLFLFRRRLKHKHHLERTLDRVTTDSAQFISEPPGLQFSLLLQTREQQRPKGKGTFFWHEATAALFSSGLQSPRAV